MNEINYLHNVIKLFNCEMKFKHKNNKTNKSRRGAQNHKGGKNKSRKKISERFFRDRSRSDLQKGEKAKKETTFSRIFFSD